MVQPLNQSQGFTQVGEQVPLALSRTDSVPDTVVQTQSPSILETKPPETPKSSQDLTQATQVAPVDSGNAPAAATQVTPQTQQSNFLSNLGSILGGILQPTEADKSTETSQTPTANEPSIQARQNDMQKNTPVVEPQKKETPVPGLEGYNSVLPDTKPDKSPDISERDRAAIRTIESGSPKGNYRAIGKKTRTGDRAYGAYQVMGANIPSWTKKYLGKPMSIREFLTDQDAQDKVFAGEFGRLKGKYGGPGAAQAWFAGEAGMRNKSAKDVNQFSVAQYGAAYTKYY